MAPETYRETPVCEMAIALWDKADDAGGEKVKEGDIVAVRRRGRDGIGLKEGHRFLWLLVEGLDWNEMSRLTQPLTDPLEPTEADLAAGNVVMHDKRRYCIPLARLKLLFRRLDLAKARDVTQLHQPCIPVDTDRPYLYLDTGEMRPLNVHALVVDKATGRFL